VTIASTTNRNMYPGAGSAGPFTFNFKIFAYTDLSVIRRSAAGIETELEYGVDFTATGVGNAAGDVTLTDALVDGEWLSIRRVRPLTQERSIRNLGPYFAATHEDAWDDLVMKVQQLEDELGRVPKVKDSWAPSQLTMSLIPEAGRVLGWTTDGILGNLELADAAAIAPVDDTRIRNERIRNNADIFGTITDLLPTTGVAFLGDSIFYQLGGLAGWFTFTGTAWVNAGVAGERTDQILARVNTDVVNVAYCVIEGGINDFQQGMTAAVAYANILAIVTALQARGIQPLLITTLPVVSTFLNAATLKAKTVQLNTMLRAYSRTTGVPLVETYGPFLGSDGYANPTYYNVDGIHPNALGQARMTSIIARGLRVMANPEEPYGPAYFPYGISDRVEIIKHLLTADIFGAHQHHLQLQGTAVGDAMVLSASDGTSSTGYLWYQDAAVAANRYWALSANGASAQWKFQQDGNLRIVAGGLIIPSGQKLWFDAAANGASETYAYESSDGVIQIMTNSAQAAAFGTVGGAGETRFFLYDVDKGAQQRVKVGAANSGGAGFKMLRVDN
jgi:lysophospholipase L1-like esterase